MPGFWRRGFSPRPSGGGKERRSNGFAKKTNTVKKKTATVMEMAIT